MNEQWTNEEVLALEGIQTFDEMVEVALVILKRMSERNKTIVQLCGPMSTGGLGDLGKNMKFFQCALEVLEGDDFIVFDQSLFQGAMIRLSKKEDHGAYCTPILEVFYRRLFESGLIKKTLFLPDWQSSKGATWERELAVRLGMGVEDYPVELLVKAKAKFKETK